MNSIENTFPLHFTTNSMPPTASNNFYQTDTKNDTMNDHMDTYDYQTNANVNKEKINNIWKNNFGQQQQSSTSLHELNLNFKATKMAWSDKDSANNNNVILSDKEDVIPEEPKSSPSPTFEVTEKETANSPPHHARRPMNAFLIFCKKHRPIVRKKYPSLENRGVTRILGEWWALLDACDKEAYTNLAKEVYILLYLSNY